MIMAEETKGDEPQAPVPVNEGEGNASTENKNEKRYKSDETSIEETFDLSKPIPRVRRPLIPRRSFLTTVAVDLCTGSCLH